MKINHQYHQLKIEKRKIMFEVDDIERIIKCLDGTETSPSEKNKAVNTAKKLYSYFKAKQFYVGLHEQSKN